MNNCFFRCRKLPLLLLLFQLTLGNLVISPTISAQSAPIINNVPDDITIDCITDLPDPVMLEATDDDDPSFPKMISPVDSPEASTITPVCQLDTIFRIWTAEDASANITRDTQLIIILPDETGPTISAGIVRDTASCEIANDDSNPMSYAVWKATQRINIGSFVSDNCSGVKELVEEEFDLMPCGTREFRFTAVDECDQSTSWSAFYTVLDTLPPTIEDVPADTTVSCNDPYITANPPTLTAMDNCSVSMTPTLEEESDQEMNGGCQQFQYTITRTWTVIDDCGNEGNAVQTISVVDPIGPQLTEPEDIIIDCTQDATDLNITGDVIEAFDVCGGEIAITRSDVKEIGGCPGDTIITRTWRARDVCGNITTRQQIITKKDTLPPTFTPPADTIVDCSIGEQESVTGRPTNIQDNCGGEFVTPGFVDTYINDPSCEGRYTVERVWTIEDSCGNRAIHLQRIEVADLQAPTFPTPAQDLTITCADDLDIEIAFDNWVTSRANLVAADNCELLDTIYAYNTGTQ